MADAETQERESQVRVAPESASRDETTQAANERIRSANLELQARTESALKLPLSVALEQRDAALRQVAEASQLAERSRKDLVEEQDRFIAFLMEDYDQTIQRLESELKQSKEDASRQRALAPADKPDKAPVGIADTDQTKELAEAHAQIVGLQQSLESAYAEVDETRRDAARLQEERDEAIREVDDVRVELYAQIDLARDESIDIQTQLDEASRSLEDARDEARNEAYRLNEELDEVRRELDDRNDEVGRLRERLAELTEEARLSQPPPPAAALALDAARNEIKSLRKQLIDSKRELSRAKRELDLAKRRASGGALGALKGQSSLGKAGAARSGSQQADPQNTASTPPPRAAAERVVGSDVSGGDGQPEAHPHSMMVPRPRS